ncbi:gamma-carboxygeranoyl-CoA hydratase [Stutzerimonas chloritidismutans]|uniref:gamma-carboxygeranoyl-CoA hydratase n=1 Tax=Stutzerimonas chloritidismutans TaxID=203192 RepID=UPI003F18957F
MTDFHTIEIERSAGGVATLWLNRPQKNNAFNAEMIAELIQSLRQLCADEHLRFLLLRGRGQHFSAGADLSWMRESAGLDYASNLRDAHELGELMHCLHQFPVPTLAVVQGAAFGGALGLIACCDMAIGTEDAQFSLSEVRIGLAPAVISPFVVQSIGARATRRYALTAERFSGKRAQAMGLLSECYPAEALDGAAVEWVGKLLQNSPQAMRITKALLADVGTGALSEALRERTEHAIASIRVSQEGQEGLGAFLEKRKPAWQEQQP